MPVTPLEAQDAVKRPWVERNTLGLYGEIDAQLMTRQDATVLSPHHRFGPEALQAALTVYAHLGWEVELQPEQNGGERKESLIIRRAQ